MKLTQKQYEKLMVLKESTLTETEKDAISDYKYRKAKEMLKALKECY